MNFSRCLFIPLFAAALVAQSPAKGSLGLPPAQADGVIQDLAGRVSFLRKDFSTRKIFKAFNADGANEDAKPLLPEEFLALPEDGRREALHPDTTCLLVMRLWRAAAWQRPEEAKSREWMIPMIVRTQPSRSESDSGLSGTPNHYGHGNSSTMAMGVRKLVGPNWPLLEFHRNLPDPDPRTGLDNSSHMTGPDKAARTWKISHDPGFLGTEMEFFFPTGDQAKAEYENWVLARILVARAEGAWDPPALKAQFLRIAAPRVPAWDPELSERLAKASENLKAPLK